MSKLLRRKVSDEICSLFENESAVFILDYEKLNAEQDVELRAGLRGDGMGVSVVKNSSAHHAFEKLGWSELQQYLDGMTMLAYGGDSASLVKRLFDLHKKFDTLQVKGAYLDGTLLSQEQCEALSKLPSRHQLLGQVVGTIAMPMNSFAWVLNGVIQKFVLALSAIAAKGDENNS